MANKITTVDLTTDDDVIVISDDEEPILMPKRPRYKKRRERPVCNITSVNAECTSEISNIKVQPANSNLEPVASTSDKSVSTSMSFMGDLKIQSKEENYINYSLKMERLKLEIFNYIEQLMNEQLLPENVNDSSHGCASVSDAFSEMDDSLLANISFNSNPDTASEITTEISSSLETPEKPSHTELMNCNVEKLLTKPLNMFKPGSVSNSEITSAIFRLINDEKNSNESQNEELISIKSLEEMFAEPMGNSDSENSKNSTLLVDDANIESTRSSMESDELPYSIDVAQLNFPEMVTSFEDPSETESVDSENSMDIPETTIKYVESSSSIASEELTPEISEPLEPVDYSENFDSDETSTESDEIESTESQELINFSQTRKQCVEPTSVVLENYDFENFELNDKNTGLDQFELLPWPASPPFNGELDKCLSEFSRSSKLCRSSSDPNISINVPCKETLSPGAARLKRKPMSLPEMGSKSLDREIQDVNADIILDCDGKVLPVNILSVFTNCKLSAEGIYELDGIPFRYISFTGTIINKLNTYDNMSTFLIDDGSAVIKCRIEEFPWIKEDRQELQMLQEKIEKYPIVPITEEDYQIENVCIFLLEKTKRIYQECPTNDDIILGDEIHIVGKVYDTSEERLVYAKYIRRENNIEFRQHRGCVPGQFMESGEFIDFTN